MLTQKQEKYVQGLIAGMSQREAYRAAYDAQSMGDNAVDVAASRLLKNPKVSLRYEELRRESEAKSGSDAASIRAEIIKQLTAMLKTDVSDYFFYVVQDGECIPMLDDLSKKNTTAIKSMGVDRYGKTKIEMYDKLAVMQRLCDMFGLNQEQAEKQSVAITAPTEYIE